MNQHDTLTLRDALRSIQYDAATLADAQVIALQALNATYPARAAISATQPAQAAQGETKRCEHCDDTGDVTSIDGHWRGYCTCQHGKAAQGEPDTDAHTLAHNMMMWVNDARQHNSEYVPVHVSTLEKMICYLSQKVASNGFVMVPKKCTEAMKDVGIQFEFATISDGRLLAQTMWNELLIAALQAPLQQAAQSEPAEHWHRLYLEKCQQYNDRVAQLGGVIEGLEAEAAQGAGEVVAIHPSWLDCWSFNECDRLARIWTAGIDLTKSDDHDNDLGPQWKVVMAIMLARLAHRAAVAPTQPAAGADVLDAERYRWLRAQDNEDFAFAVVKNPHFDVYESPEELDAHIDAAIAASGRQE